MSKKVTKGELEVLYNERTQRDYILTLATKVSLSKAKELAEDSFEEGWKVFSTSNSPKKDKSKEAPKDGKKEK